MAASTLQGFSPLIAAGARVLILGNMPGVASLNAARYYAHTRNAFWPITAELYGFDASAPYDDRVAALTHAGVAVWDVLRSCRRAGSLDSAVERESMVSNDFVGLFAAHPGIAHICFNGAAADRNYRRLVGADPCLRYTRLPSTSPAHTMAFADMLAAWRRGLFEPLP